MRTARSSSHPGGVCTRSPQTMHTPEPCTPLGPFTPPKDHAAPRTMHHPNGPGTPPTCEQNHIRLWKYNLAPTSLLAVKTRIALSLRNPPKLTNQMNSYGYVVALEKNLHVTLVQIRIEHACRIEEHVKQGNAGCKTEFGVIAKT